MLETKILKTADNYSEVISNAVDTLQNGGIVVYPTETVYGIGCSLFDTKAAQRLYELKDRDRRLPLTANIAYAGQAYDIAIDIPDEYFVLAERFLPGPLSIILKKDKNIPEIITSGLDTIAIRIPDNKCFLGILDAYEQPVAGTSANISGKGAFAGYEETAAIFGGLADLIIDDGDCRIGIESTIISLAGEYPKIIRAGAISRQDIELCLKMKTI